jgi:threonine/homoserine/homoserine lactone efflux protein
VLLDSFLRGSILGFSVAAPIGPIGLLCIHRTLHDGRLTGFVSGLGAAAADALYATVAAFGLSALTRALVENETWIHGVAGAVLVLLGLKIALSRPAERRAQASGSGVARAFAVTFALTITNPLTILSFLGLFAGIQRGSEISGLGAVLLVAGVFGGSAAWWLILSTAVSLLRARIDARRLRWVNVLAGVAILGLGAAAAFSS